MACHEDIDHRALNSWRVCLCTAGGAFALVAKDPNDAEAIERIRRYFEFLASHPQFGIHKLYSQEGLKKTACAHEDD
jgi:hypothetical protein